MFEPVWTKLKLCKSRNDQSFLIGYASVGIVRQISNCLVDLPMIGCGLVAFLDLISQTS